MSAPVVYGLVLAGGRSSRMKQDKAVLQYRGRSQLDRAVDLAERHVELVFVSVRGAQSDDPARSGKRLILDSVVGEGPIVGIRSALAAYPEVAWLVLACDLPFLSGATLERLLTERDPQALATAYRSIYDGLPEPLCAIYEPAAREAIDAYQATGGTCPRKFLIRNGARIIESEDARALDNVNTPEEYARALAALGSDT